MDYLSHNANSDTTLATQWAALKAVLRADFIAIASADNADRLKKRTELTQQVTELEHIHHRTGAPRIWRQLRIALQHLAALDQDRAENAALRLRHAFYTGGDKGGRLLAHKLRDTRQKHSVQSI